MLDNMETLCSVQSLRSVKNIHRISVWNAAQLGLQSPREQEELRCIIDGLGKLSAQAQHLRIPITDYGRLKTASHTLYILTTGVQGKPEYISVKGMLKVGRKNLFIRRDNGQLVEMSPLCVLDFFVHESCQRIGLGHELFEAMLAREKTTACDLGYDRPSSKCLSFLAKHYNLLEYLPQANQYVVFNDYFKDESKEFEIKEGHSKRSALTSYLEPSCKKEKILHGRRAHASEHSRKGSESSQSRKLEDVIQEGNYYQNQHQRCGRKQSRHHVPPNTSLGEKVPCLLDSSELHLNTTPQTTPSGHSERDNLRATLNAAAQEYKPSMYGRRSMLSKPSDVRKESDRSVRYLSPPSVPKPVEEEKALDSSTDPLNFAPTGNTRSRLFHEDACFERSTKPKPALNCPFWVDEAKTFRSRCHDSLDNISSSLPSPVAFEETRSCYHAGMRGYGAAEAMGWSCSLIK